MTAPGPLRIAGVSISFGGVAALTEVSFEVAPGRIVGVIGANGAGKTTLLNCISGFNAPQRGTVRLGEVDLLRLKAHQLIRARVSRTFQHLELFPMMTALENLLVAQVSVARTGFLGAALRTPAFRREDRHLRAQAREMLRLVGLAEYEDWRLLVSAKALDAADVRQAYGSSHRWCAGGPFRAPIHQRMPLATS